VLRERAGLQAQRDLVIVARVEHSGDGLAEDDGVPRLEVLRDAHGDVRDERLGGEVERCHVRERARAEQVAPALLVRHAILLHRVLLHPRQRVSGRVEALRWVQVVP